MKNVYIIAEAGVNHNGKLDQALKMVDAAVDAGADAIKFQTYKAKNLVSKVADVADYQKKGKFGIKESQLMLLESIQLRFEDFIKIKEYCQKRGIVFLTTPFDYESADFIEELIDVYKISSGDLTNIPFLRHISAKGKPIILSTGMGTLGEVEQAIWAIKDSQKSLEYDADPLTLLHCTTNYPCPYNEINLTAMNTLRRAFQLPVGYSDHSLGIEVPIAAAALGARVIEKHFTLDRSLPGPDHKASLEPTELGAMISAIRNIESALGDGMKRPNPSEIEISGKVRKSLVVNTKLNKGTVITRTMIEIKRPGNGIPPSEIENIIGLKLARNKDSDEILFWDDFKSEA